MIVANIGDIFLSLRPLRPPARQPWEPIVLPYASQHTQTRTHTYTHTDTHTHTYKHTHTRTHTNKHIHTQTYTHIHTHVDHQPLLIDCSAVPHHSSNHMMLAYIASRDHICSITRSVCFTQCHSCCCENRGKLTKDCGFMDGSA